MATPSDMGTTPDPVTTNLLGQRIRKARTALGYTQEVLARPRFSKAYISAVERGTIHPSLKALEFLAERLSVPTSELLSEWIDVESSHAAQHGDLQEELYYQINYARMLIRTNQVEEALELLGQAQASLRPHWDVLPAGMRYLIPFTRGQAYMQLSDHAQARSHLEEALVLAQDDDVALVQVHNLLGALLRQQQPEQALEHHLRCLPTISNKVKDPRLRASILHNLADDYRALNESEKAIDTYKEALAVLDDLADLRRRADIYRDMAAECKGEGNWTEAKLHATCALILYEALDTQSEAAASYLNLAGMRISEDIGSNEDQYADVEHLLERAERLLVANEDKGLWSVLFRHKADVACKQGALEEAAGYAAESISYAESMCQADVVGNSARQNDWNYIYAEALHVAARVEEATGHTDVADRLFERALEQASEVAIPQAVSAISFSYAEALCARGSFRQAADYYRAAAAPLIRSRLIHRLPGILV